MVKNDFEKFRALLIGTAGSWGQYLPPESIPIWFNDLIHYELNEIENAFEIFRKDSAVQKLPTQGQLIYTIHSLRKKPTEFEIDKDAVPPPKEFIESFKGALENFADEKTAEKFEVKTLNDVDLEKWQETFASQVKFKGGSRRK